MANSPVKISQVLKEVYVPAISSLTEGGFSAEISRAVSDLQRQHNRQLTQKRYSDLLLGSVRYRGPRSIYADTTRYGARARKNRRNGVLPYRERQRRARSK